MRIRKILFFFICTAVVSVLVTTGIMAAKLADSKEPKSVVAVGAPADGNPINADTDPLPESQEQEVFLYKDSSYLLKSADSDTVQQEDWLGLNGKMFFSRNGSGQASGNAGNSAADEEVEAAFSEESTIENSTPSAAGASPVPQKESLLTQSETISLFKSLQLLSETADKNKQGIVAQVSEPSADEVIVKPLDADNPKSILTPVSASQTDPPSSSPDKSVNQPVEVSVVATSSPALQLSPTLTPSPAPPQDSAAPSPSSPAPTPVSEPPESVEPSPTAQPTTPVPTPTAVPNSPSPPLIAYNTIIAATDKEVSKLRLSCQNTLGFLYQQYKKAATDEAKDAIVDKGLTSMASCDTKFDVIMTGLTLKLTTNQYAVSVVQVYRNQYEKEKNSALALLLN